MFDLPRFADDRYSAWRTPRAPRGLIIQTVSREISIVAGKSGTPAAHRGSRMLPAIPNTLSRPGSMGAPIINVCRIPLFDHQKNRGYEIEAEVQQ